MHNFFVAGGNMAVTLANSFPVRMHVQSSRPAEHSGKRALGKFLVGAKLKSEPGSYFGHRSLVLAVRNFTDGKPE